MGSMPGPSVTQQPQQQQNAWPGTEGTAGGVAAEQLDMNSYAYAQQAYMSGGYEAYAAYSQQGAYDPSGAYMDPSQYGYPAPGVAANGVVQPVSPAAAQPGHQHYAAAAAAPSAPTPAQQRRAHAQYSSKPVLNNVAAQHTQQQQQQQEQQQQQQQHAVPSAPAPRASTPDASGPSQQATTEQVCVFSSAGLAVQHPQFSGKVWYCKQRSLPALHSVFLSSARGVMGCDGAW
eukprot:scaffold13758_cov18-Tisochrysis_lutea.AAC.1